MKPPRTNRVTDRTEGVFSLRRPRCVGEGRAVKGRPNCLDSTPAAG